MGHGDSAAVVEYGASLPQAAAGLLDLARFLALAVILLAVTWGRWPDMLSDCGRELYIPWQLAGGKALYRDFFYLNGPLSPYYHALLFRLCGASLLALVASNLLVLALTAGLIYRLILEMADRRTAQIAVAVFLLLFGFGHLENSGNYNWITPYSHELTHGLLLALALLALLARDQGQVRAGGRFGAGLLYGSIFLTKVEIFVAATALVLAWLALLRRRRLQALGVFLAGTLLPVVAFGVFLASQMDRATALRGLAGGWWHLWATPLAGQFFYQKLAGLDNPWGSLRTLAAGTASALLLAVAAAGYDYYRTRRRSAVLAGGVGLALLAACWLKLPLPPLLAGPELPAVALAGTALGVSAICQTTREANRGRYLLFWSVLAGALLLRFGLKPRLAHYGFVLALPAALLLLVVLLHRLPRVLAAGYGGGLWFRRLALAGVTVSVGFWLVLSLLCYQAKTVWVGRGADSVRTYSARWDPLSFGLAQATAYIARQTPLESTVVVLPEGALVNYLARRQNPTAYLSFMPAEQAIVGEAAMLAALQQTRPDYVLLVGRRLPEYGYPPYGVGDFGREILAWVYQEYDIVEQFGSFVSLYKIRHKEVTWTK